jgi:predicted alpha/beta-fold hydrolase
MPLRGHLWTIAPFVAARVKPARVTHSQPWRTTTRSPRGEVTLTGRLHRRSNRHDRVVVLVHGLGGSFESHYIRTASEELARRDVDHVRINLRGADRLGGNDYYHAGLIDDLAATLESEELRPFREVILWGSSLGAHVSLRYAALTRDPRVRAVVAVCPPLDLAPGAVEIDHWSRRPYLGHMLRALNEIYASVARTRRDVPISIARARSIRSIRRWDNEVVAPWHGFASADDYYDKVSVGPHLPSLETRSLVVVGRDDPMIPVSVVHPALARASRAVDARTVAGGHVGFSSSLDLGERGALGLDPQVCAWLERI